MQSQVQKKDLAHKANQAIQDNISQEHSHNNSRHDPNNKNETQDKTSIKKETAMQRMTEGFSKIFQALNFAKGFDEFTTAFNNIKTQQAVSPANNISISLQNNVSFAPSQTQFMKQEEETENLNKTPFFGDEHIIHKSNHSQKQKSQTFGSKIFNKISNKNQQALIQFTTNYNLLFSAQLPSIIDKIFNKNLQAVKQLFEQYNQLDKSQQVIGNKSEPKSQQPNSSAFFKQDSKMMDIQDDNEFMAEQFGSHQKLEQIKKYVNDIKTQAVQKYLQQNYYSQKDLVYLINKIQQVDQKILKHRVLQELKYWRAKTPIISDYSTAKKQQDKSNSARVSQRMSSAQSQRLQSAISKNSENEESFNLDLTMKTKHSKNLYQIGKGDSLMYSADSGFGLLPESSHKNQKADNRSNSSQSVQQKLDEIQQQKQHKTQYERKGSLQKNHSEKINHEKSQKIVKRIFSSKQKIEQHQQQQNEQHSIAHKQIEQQKIQSFQDIDQINANKINQLKPKYRNYEHQDQDQNYNKMQNQNQKISKLQQKQHIFLKNDKHKNHEKSAKQQRYGQLMNSKKKHKQLNDQSSQRQDTIINRVQNFDADDEDEQIQRDKELHESVNLAKSRKTQKLVKKRVQTQAAKNKQDQQPRHNYSIKNIKRFNKVDFSKLQQKSHRSSSQAINHNNNQSVFTTQINNYQNKISKLRQQKELKKKNLEQELARINHQIKVLHQKQQQFSPEHSQVNKNGYASRVKISDNNEAQRKAESLVKNLRSQKRNRNIAKIGQFSNLDRNINDYMEQLTKLRSQNQQKIKYKKKLEILQRMKLNQVRKINEKKKITENQQFVLHLKGVGPNSNIKNEIPQFQAPVKRSPTKQSQQTPISNQVSNNPTPELTNKKAYLNKIRSFTIKKQKPKDAYEQLLA